MINLFIHILKDSKNQEDLMLNFYLKFLILEIISRDFQIKYFEFFHKFSKVYLIFSSLYNQQIKISIFYKSKIIFFLL